MDINNERTFLLEHTSSGRLRRTASRLCSVDFWKRRLPITIWLPKYTLENFVRDGIAGITVGLTSIPQGIAYAIIAGLPAQVGLYSSAFPGIVYVLFGSCKVVTVGPTAILAALLAKYVALSPDFAYLAAFLAGCVILLLGVLQLGFLLDFISKPVICGFTTAAALQIGATQIKSLFRLSGPSASTFIDAVVNSIKNIKTIHLWDSVLGITTIISLLLLKQMKVPVTQQSSRGRLLASQAALYAVRARPALAVGGAALLASCLHAHDVAPFALTGITVGLTSIPQGIAYAIIAGLPAQVGLYSSAFPGIVYVLFGSCKVVTVGPTAILAALLAKYVALSPDFAYLAAFLAGCVILLLGVLQLGFLLDFISKPVICGFTTAAALQIGATQIKSLFRLSGPSASTFIDAVVNSIKNIKTIHLWDSVLGITTIISLLLLKQMKVPVTQQSSRGRLLASQAALYAVRARPALAVGGAALLASCLHAHDVAPFALTGKIDGGLPNFGPPPFMTVVNNQTVYFEGMLKVFGPEGFVIPLVAILESIAIAKAFAGGTSVDGTQEMIALGLCNLVSSFAQAMPATGSFTRTALNHASGVTTPAGSLFKAALVLLSVTLMTRAFYFIPRSSLAGVIIVAMMSIVEFKIIAKLWNNSKVELLVYCVTVLTGVTLGLEWGVAAGVAGDAARSLAAAARPGVNEHRFKVGNQDCVLVTMLGSLSYASAEYISSKVRASTEYQGTIVIVEGRHLRTVDIGVAENLISVILELEREGHWFLFWNCPAKVERLFEDLQPGFQSRFVVGNSIDQHVLSLDLQRRNNSNNYNTIS